MILSERTPARRLIAVAAMLLVILVITLTPAANRAPLRFSFELGVAATGSPMQS